MATISTDSLRVRALPDENAEVVAGVEEGEVFPVSGISSDGAWIQISIDEAPDGLGWVSAGFVTLAGDITNIEIVEVATVDVTEGVTDTEELTGTTEITESEEVTAEVTEEATEEASEEVTEDATAEATVEATEEVSEEATAEATEEATEEADAAATEDEGAVEEATPEPTEEAIEEEASEEVTTSGGIGSVVEEATEADADEATPEATGELGTVTIVADPPLRVRSEPTTDEENKIGNVFDGEVYEVLEVSEDGLWVRIAVPELGDGTGWVSAEFVVFNEDTEE